MPQRTPDRVPSPTSSHPSLMIGRGSPAQEVPDVPGAIHSNGGSMVNGTGNNHVRFTDSSPWQSEVNSTSSKASMGQEGRISVVSLNAANNSFARENSYRSGGGRNSSARASSVHSDSNVDHSLNDSANLNDDTDSLGLSDCESQGTARTGTSRYTDIDLKHSHPMYRLIRRVPFPVWVAVSIVIPLGFLLGVQSDTVSRNAETVDYIETHKPLFTTASACQSKLMVERGSSTIVLTWNTTSGFNTMMNTRPQVDQVCDEFYMQANRSPDPALVEFSKDFRNEMETIAVARFAIDKGVTLNFTSGNQRKIYTRVIHELDRARSIVAVHPSVASSAVDFFRIKFYSAASNELGICRAVGAEISGMGGVGVTESLVAEFFNCVSSFDFFVRQLKSISATGLTQFETDPTKVLAREMMGQLLANPRHSHNWTSGEWFDVFSRSLAKEPEIDFEKPAQRSLGKHVKILVFALFFGIAAASFVMWLQFDTMRRIDASMNEARTTQKAISKFVPRAFLKLTGCTSILQVTVGNQTQVAVSMLFSDIRNFTGMSAGMSSETLFLWLEGYLRKMTNITERANGFVDKFIGDAVFAVFVAPKDAVLAGVNMQRETEQLNVDMKCDGGTNLLKIGVGIHHGVASAGFLGDDNRVNATLVSSEVNMASRLEGLTKHYDAKILISDVAAAQVPSEAFRLRRLGKARAVGAQEDLDLVEVYSTDDVELQAYKTATKETWESGVDLRLAGNIEGSNVCFQQCAAIADELGVKDTALAIKLKNTESCDTWSEK